MFYFLTVCPVFVGPTLDCTNLHYTKKKSLTNSLVYLFLLTKLLRNSEMPPLIQGVLSEDLDQRMTGLTAQIEAIRDNVASLDIKITEMAETNQDTNDRVKNIENLILAIVQARPIKKPR